MPLTVTYIQLYITPSLRRAVCKAIRLNDLQDMILYGQAVDLHTGTYFYHDPPKAISFTCHFLLLPFYPSTFDFMLAGVSSLHCVTRSVSLFSLGGFYFFYTWPASSILILTSTLTYIHQRTVIWFLDTNNPLQQHIISFFVDFLFSSLRLGSSRFVFLVFETRDLLGSTLW